MTFNSIQFILFFVLVGFTYFLLPYRFRWIFLLLASCYFYMAFIPVYILILFFLIMVDYTAGILIEQNTGKKRKVYLILSIISNIGILGFFKYFNFLSANLTAFAQAIHWNYSLPLLSVALPIGLSFHTFQALSYTIEVYRGKQKAERHLGIYALYVMFFPQLVAGPIERPQQLLPQLHQNFDFDYERVTYGLKRMAWGFFKKVVVADHLAIIVNMVYGNPKGFTGPALIMATIFFAFQIYADFSAYTDIALGSAQILGITLMENFNSPYLSKSISEFWRRWHISLSSWFRDYVYIPLGGNRVAKWRWQTNLLITFLICGLWHGANWSYVLWGGLNGFYLVFALWTAKSRSAIREFTGLTRYPLLLGLWSTLTTFILTCLAWILFRANSMADSLYIYTHLQTGLTQFFTHIYSYYTWKNLLSLSGLITKDQMAISIFGIAAIILSDLIQIKEPLFKLLALKPFYMRWTFYYLLLAAILLFGIFGSQEFIYFQF